ncbi:iron complex transport system substrate-binding protein [Tranquillimonas rosea]|uniref:Iron complex transport system substrate-binding protein n=1 Tax=Tranquillimonas rosea TaxID=641238 RepID=A0A1H9WX05_9RHOB|nr:iron-siderophore ABC transporter substrate-binding protein [Tranquillimonas rosea]SES38217.1 iron complex transport system substrate-binding protein [Tranquillimonas rosea]
MRRRAFLAAGLALLSAPAAAEIEVSDRRGAQSFDAVPERVVVMDWALAEQVLDLGITPVGAPELDLYRDWVGQPAMPDDVTDIGLRTEPNLERLAALSPDVIVASGVEPDQIAVLERIAPVLAFDAFSADHDNVAAARDIFLTLARLFGREDRAEEKLAAMEDELDRIAADLEERYGDRLTQVTAVRLNDDSTVWIYGDNSIPTYVLGRLGFDPEVPVAASKWGVAQRPLEDLAKVEEGALLAIRPHMGGAAAFDSPLWQALPAVRAGRFAEAEPVWSYGGILSVLRHARAFRDALTMLDPS